MPISLPFDDAYVLTGPTGSGKSALALVLAERLDAEIICMDSMSLYRGMDIGTAKPSATDRQRVPHHLLDVLEPWESGSVAWWLEQATEAAEKINKRGKKILVVGGTPLYLKALIHGLFSAPKGNQTLRHELEELATNLLHEKLQSVDPQAAKRIHVNDRKRLVRALEVFYLTDQPISLLQQQFQTSRSLKNKPLWLNWPRELLYQRIETRIDAMLAHAWLDEVRRLLALPLPLGKEARQAAGYRELTDYLNGKLTWEQAVLATKTRTRQLAKRQLTWLRNFPGLEAIRVDGNESIAELANACLLKWQAPLS